MNDSNARADRPNILIIYVDQLRADAIGCAGNPVIRTPHIDRLAYEGVRFDHAYNAFPLCCPFRASLLTGKYPHSHGLRANHYPVPLDQTFLAEIFRDAGYSTGYIGKWHLDGGPKHSYVPPGERRLGFEHFVGFNRGHEYFGSIFYRDSEQPLTSERYEPDFQTDHLIEFMRGCLEDPRQKPFLAEICYSPPHPPLIAPPHYQNLYADDEVPVRDNVPDDPGLLQRVRGYLSRYYGLTATVDHNVGKVLDWLDKKGLAQDTVVIMLSDHGDMVGEHGMFNKKTYHDAAMRVPLIVRYPPRFAGGRVISSMIDPSVDTMPTLLQLCGLEIPETVQGSSYLPVLDGQERSTREAVFYEICMEKEGPERFPTPERGVRTEEWLYVRTEAGSKVLFDLYADPLEMKNLTKSTKHRQVIERLDTMLQHHMKVTNDSWESEAVFPPPDFVTLEEGHEVWKSLWRSALVEP